jgi:superfamily II DNA or RNA helicase
MKYPLLKEFLGLAPGDIGFIGSGKRKPSGRVDIALIQSLCRTGVVDDIVQGYGHLATGRYLGEGFDDARLDTLFLTLPISWKGTLAQYAGRLHCLHYSKREVRIYDYADLRVAMLERMFKRRLGGYRGLGYETEGAMGKGSSRQAR